MRTTVLAMLLGAAIFTTTPTALNAQDKRVYDRDHKDYHNWTSDEDRAYRHWVVEERHEKYRTYGRLNSADQRAYWQWRHDHADWH